MTMPKITELRCENFKRLTAVTIRPDGSVVVLNGGNGQGKTSVLDGIWAALGGKKAAPDVPIRAGARKASTQVTLDTGLVVKKAWTAAGASQLTITGADGATLRSPQAVLNELCSQHTVDPLAFATQKGAEQATLLRLIVGLDFTEQDTNREVIYDRRTEKNRDVKRLAGQLASMPARDLTVPAEEVSAQDTHDDYMAAVNAMQEIAGRRKTIIDTRQANEKLEQRIVKLSEELARCEASLVERQQWVLAETDSVARLTETLVDPEAVLGRSAQLDKINALVRANAARVAVEGELAAARDEAERLTDAIDAIDTEKATLLAAAKFPVDGLGFDEDGVTYHGLPFSQASHAERLRVSTAIGLALNPKLRVLLIRDAEKLDADGMRLIAELAEENDAQLWLERAGHSDPGAVVIEDGAVA